MVNDMILEIENVGPISNAKIDIGKINIIGGSNSSGKSTASKLLYCFLRANSADRQGLALYPIASEVNDFSREIHYSDFDFNDEKFLSPSRWGSLLRRCSRDNDLERFKKTFKDFENLFNKMLLSDPGTSKLSSNINKSHKKSDVLKKIINQNPNHENKEEFVEIIKMLESIESENDDEDEEYSLEINNPKLNNLNDKFNTIKQSLDIVEKNSEDLYIRVMKELLDAELDINEVNNFDRVSLRDDSDKKFNYSINLNNFNFECDGWFDLNKVFYLESYSIYDAHKRPYLWKSNYPISEHDAYLFRHIMSISRVNKTFDDLYNKKLVKIEKIIGEIIGGYIDKGSNGLEYKSDKYSCSLNNTASGIKQISVLQTLIRNRVLQPNSFLIIDEPEVNLHPEWQLKFAQILVLIAKDLDINVYINSHSPLFIQAIDTFSQVYGLYEDTNYYLTEPTEVEGKFTFRKVSYDKLEDIYYNLGEPYDVMRYILSQIEAKAKEDKISKIEND